MHVNKRNKRKEYSEDVYFQTSYDGYLHQL